MLPCAGLYRNTEIVSNHDYCYFYSYNSYGKVVLNLHSYITIDLCFKEGSLCVCFLGSFPSLLEKQHDSMEDHRKPGLMDL